jgi:hypothetical protein
VPFIGAEGGGSNRTVEGNDGWRWSAMIVMEAAVSGGDRPRRDEGGATRAILGVEGGGAPGGGSPLLPAAVAPGGRPREEDDRAGRAGWAGRRPRPRQFGNGSLKGGKGEWAGRSGRRGRPLLGRIRSRARIQKKFFSNFN